MPNSGVACSAIRPAHSARSSASTGQEMPICLPSESIWVRIAAVPWAKAQRSPNSMRARTSAADQLASRSAMTLFERAHEAAVGIAAARPDMALVEMDMAIDQARQHDAAVEIESGFARSGLRARRQDRADAPIRERDIDQRKAIAIRRQRGSVRSGSAAPAH